MVLLGYIKEVATVAQALSTLATRRQLHTLHCIVVVSGESQVWTGLYAAAA